MEFPDAAALLGEIDPPLWLVTARAGDRRGGLVATFVSNASIIPGMPRMLAGVAQQHHTWELIQASGAFALHLLGEENIPLVWRFGLQSGREVDKLHGLEVVEGPTGSPLLADTLGWLDCRVENRMDTGDRTVYLGEVVAAKRTRPTQVLTVKRLLSEATAEVLEQLKGLMARDSALDAEAIRGWRERMGKQVESV